MKVRPRDRHDRGTVARCRRGVVPSRLVRLIFTRPHRRARRTGSSRKIGSVVSPRIKVLFGCCKTASWSNVIGRIEQLAG